MYDEDDLLPLSSLSHWVYCPRQAGLILLEAAWADDRATAEGSLLHNRTDQPELSESRPGIRIARALRLQSLRLGLSGIADVVEFHEAGEDEADTCALPGRSGRWRPFPVEYKRGRLRHEPSFRVQLCAQAMCLEETFGVPVLRGALFYAKTARRDTLDIDADLRAQTEQAAARLHELVASGETPRAEYGPKCEQCSLLPLCMPKALAKRRSVAAYVDRALREEEPPT